MISYLQFRSNALQGLTIVKQKPPICSKDELEKWILKEYRRHLKKENKMSSHEKIPIILNSYDISDINLALFELGKQGNSYYKNRMKRIVKKIKNQTLKYCKGK